MPDHRHSYYKTHPNGIEQEYNIYALPTSEDAPDSAESLDRDQAIKEARTKPGARGSILHVTVFPCPCGDCTLSRYAERHPQSPVSDRAEIGRLKREDR